ncbi:MAG: peptidoglycan DD-metalloendopeptidase family protein [Clostridia bacterium]|nr:peptidoglycan DD-metalloendopeptidase family protein [Clostridia bacterium]
MKSNIKKALIRGTAALSAGIIALSTFVFAPAEAPVYSSAASDATVKRYEEEIAALNKQQKDLLAKINASKSEANEVSQTKSYLDNLIYTLEAKISTADALISELQAKINSTTDDIEAREEQIEETTAKFMERMRMAHEDGNTSYLGMILGAESISDFLSRMERVNAMLEYDKTLKNQFRLEKETLEKERADLSLSVQIQQETLASLETDKAEAEKQAATAASYYASLQADTAAYQAAYNKAKAEEEKLDAELEAMLKAISEQNSSQVTAKGEFMWPLPVNKGYISCYFGGRDPGGRPHYALDIAISYGTPIYAANDGTVVTAAWHYSYGYYVVIDHGNGRSTLYAHASALNVSAGQTVSKGQVVAKVGSTGYSTGNHLHFEFRVNGNKVNPLGYIQKGV